MSTVRALQLASLSLLWLLLLLQGQLQTLVALGLAVLLALQLRRQPLPRPLLLGLTVITLVLGASEASLGDRSALLRSACNLLWLLSGLKLLEAHRPADQRRCSLLLLLAVGLAGLGAQGLGASLGQGLCALLALASLLALEGGPSPLGPVLRRSGTLVALALPVLLVAFVLLPRLEPLWSLQLGGQGRSGLGDRLAPGELASLVLDDSLAARVSFSSPQPPPAQRRYWRVLVHQRFDGSSWSEADTPAPWLQLPPPPAGAALQERWMVEPSGLRQRPWSGAGVPGGDDLWTTTAGTLVGQAPLEQRSLYGLAAGPGSQLWQQIGPQPVDLQLPPAANPRLRALGASWGRQALTPEARLQLARQWYLEQGFRYTLDPGSLGTIDPLDGFLFESRAGFCEHFAASFSALMRAAGVPARVVVGYQGGSWQQPVGGQPFLELRNSDAHAWSEVWLPGQGWVAVDPTAWVVPERVRRSLAASLSAADQQRLGRLAPGWLQAAAQQWRGLDYRWQLWVMGFDRQQQRQLLGESHWLGVLALLAMAVALAAALLPLWWSTRRRPGDRARHRLERMLALLSRQGHGLQRGETLVTYCRRVGSEVPELAIPLQLVGELYTHWRFAAAQGKSPEQALIDAMDRCSRQIRRLKGPSRQPTGGAL